MAALRPTLEIKLDLDPGGLIKGTGTAKMHLNGMNKTVGNSIGHIDRFKKSLASMWRITGGIVLFNIIRSISRAIRGLVGTVFDFDTAMRNVNSVAQLSEVEFKKLTNAVLDLSLDPRIKDGPAKLAEGLYIVTSAGYDAQEALVIMKQAALASTAGMTTSAVAADVLISTLGAYGLGVEHAASVTNSLFQIVNISKYSFEDLAGALDSVTPTAAALGISIDHVGAALAVMAAKGVDANTATVQLNAILSAMLKPTDAMKAALGELGFESGQQMLQTLGFTKTMQVWGNVIDNNAELAAALFGDVRALRGVFSTTNDGAMALTKNFELMTQAQDKGGAMTRALNEQMKAASFQIDAFKKNLQILAIMGFGLVLPYINKFMTAVNLFATTGIKAFRHFKEKGYSNFEALRAAIKQGSRKLFGKETYIQILKWTDIIISGIKTVISIIKTAWGIIGPILGFIVKHFNILGPAILGAVAGFKAYKIAVAAANVITKLFAGTLFTLNPWLLAIMALVALVTVAWINNWGDIQGKTKVAIAFISKWLGKLWDFMQPVIKIIVLFGRYISGVLTGDIAPLGKALQLFPKWLQPLVAIFGRLAKMVRVFFKVWANKGFLAALKTIPKQIRALGRAVGKFLDQLGLHKFADAVRAQFRIVAEIFGKVVSFVDNLVHGRWKKAFGDLKDIAVLMIRLFVNNLKMGLSLLYDIFKMIPWGKIASAIWDGLKRLGAWFIGTAVPWLTMKGFMLLHGLYLGIVSAWDNVVLPWLLDVAKNIIDEFVGAAKWLYDAGNDIIEGLGLGITYGWNWLWGWFSKLGDRIVGAFHGAETWLKWAGHAIMNGLWNGMVAVANWIREHFNALFSWMPEALKKKFGMASPSKVFADIGKNISLGLALGISSGMGDVRKAVDNMDGALGRRTTNIQTPRLSTQSARRIQQLSFGPGSIIVNGASGQNEDVIAEKVAWKIIREADSFEAGQA